jgi:hypothetical protein
MWEPRGDPSGTLEAMPILNSLPSIQCTGNAGRSQRRADSTSPHFNEIRGFGKAQFSRAE